MKNWFILVLAFGAIACDEKKEKETTAEDKTHFVVEGNIENGRGSVIILARIGGQNADIVATDTADKDGNFRLQGFAREKFIAVFNFDISKKIFLIVDTADRIQMKIPEQNYDDYQLTGSPESQTFRELRNIEVESGKALSELRKATENMTNSKQLEIEKEKYETVYNSYIRRFTDTLKKIESPLVQLYYHSILQVPFDDSLKTILYNNAVKSGLQGMMVQQYIGEYRSQLATAPGQMAPELNITDTSGNPIALSSLRGKVVLVDFWASWCGPCRQENPNVLRLYQQYKSKGFEIYGVSLDQEMPKWVEAIHKDGIHWIHVSELSQGQSSASRLYGVSSIPSTFLLDREGKIIARNLRGKELEAKLRQVLK